MSLQNTVFTFNKGFDRSVVPFKADRETCYELLNLRPARDGMGRLEQTPYFTLNTYTARDYWNGSTTVTESSTGEIVGGWAAQSGNAIFTRKTLSINGTQVPIYYQTTSATGLSPTKGCRIVINNVAGLGLTLGQTFDVEIDGATTFKWRKAGGAYTTLVPITTAGVPVDGGNVTVYFLTATGFTATDAWSWTRTDSTESPVTTDFNMVNLVSRTWRGDLFWLSVGGRVMRLMPSQSTGYAISVGYQPIYGYDLEIFYDHLFVANGRVNSTTYTRDVLNSDVLDIENFIPVDTNEADSHTFAESLYGIEASSAGYSHFHFMIANGRLFVYTGTEVHATAYLGLPIVFSWDEVGRFAFGFNANQSGRMAQGANHAYILRQEGLWVSDGITHNCFAFPMGLSILTQTVRQIVFSVDSGEVVIHDSATNLLWVYDTLRRTWYRRGCDMGSGTVAPSTIFYLGLTLCVGADRGLFYYTEDQLFLGTPVKDASNGTAFTLPTVTTQLLGYGFYYCVKECESVTLLAGTYMDGGVSSDYLTAANVLIGLNWHVSTNGRIGTMTSGPSWTTANVSGKLDPVRFSFRMVAFQLVVTTNDTAKPPAGVEIYQLEPNVTASLPEATR